jgi:hypothetical protein
MTEQPTAGATLDGEHDHYWDLRPIVNDDLAAFVRDEDRHRSMTVVREPGDRDTAGETRRWMDQLRADTAAEQPCTAMQRIVEKWSDGSRDAQLRGVLAAARADEWGHRGLAAALDQLWSVRAKDARDFDRLVEFARRRVVTDPSPTDRIGCRCDVERRVPGNHASAQPPTRKMLIGLVRKVLVADDAERPQLLAWATAKLRGYATAGQLDAVYVGNVIDQLHRAAGGGQ